MQARGLPHTTFHHPPSLCTLRHACCCSAHSVLVPPTAHASHAVHRSPCGRGGPRLDTAGRPVRVGVRPRGCLWRVLKLGCGARLSRRSAELLCTPASAPAHATHPPLSCTARRLLPASWQCLLEAWLSPCRTVSLCGTFTGSECATCGNCTRTRTLPAVRKRIKATGNVAKLTGVMKMVASAKARAAEEALMAGRPFGVSGHFLGGHWRSASRAALHWVLGTASLTLSLAFPTGVPDVQRVLR